MKRMDLVTQLTLTKTSLNFTSLHLVSISPQVLLLLRVTSGASGYGTSSTVRDADACVRSRALPGSAWGAFLKTVPSPSAPSTLCIPVGIGSSSRKLKARRHSFRRGWVVVGVVVGISERWQALMRSHANVSVLPYLRVCLDVVGEEAWDDAGEGPAHATRSAQASTLSGSRFRMRV